MILPSCNHYSNYFHARTDMLIKFAEPISLMPYYEQYKEHPRETMTQINTLVRNTIQQMMLHVEDLEHYDQIDFLRETEFGKRYAIKNGFKPNFLPSRLRSDQRLVDTLQKAYEEHPAEMEEVYKDVAELSDEYKRLGIRDWLFVHNAGIGALLLRGLGLLILLPLFIASIIPTGLLFLIPKIFLKRLIKDQMFVSSFNVGASAFISVPLCLIIPVIAIWIMYGFWWALGYFVAFPVMFILAWNYMRIFQKFKGTCAYVAPRNKPTIERLRRLRKSVHRRLNNLIK